MSFWDIPGMKAGVVTGDLAWALLQHAKANKYAIPAFNCTSSSVINSVLEAGKELNRPVMIQFSEGGAAFVAGKSLPNEKGKLQASLLATGPEPQKRTGRLRLEISVVEVFCAGCRNQCDQKCVIDNHEVEILQGPLTEGGPSYAENCCQQMRPASIGSPLSQLDVLVCLQHRDVMRTCHSRLVQCRDVFSQAGGEAGTKPRLHKQRNAGHRNRTVSMSSRPGPEWSSETLSVLLSPRLLAFSLPEYASILGAVAGAHFVRAVAPAYGIPVIVHSDHCAKKLLPWFDGMLEADEAFFKQHGEPLFSSHMLDLSEEPDEENIAICAKYLTRMAPMKQILDMEIGITGGVEDGVDNSGAAKEKLYSTPADVFAVYKALNPISPMFTIAAAFGNVHGVYKAGNVVLKPELLEDPLALHGRDMQVYAREQVKSTTGQDIERPLNFVFHGGSGSEKHHITTALNAGVVKMNVDTDTQWAYWEGLLKFYKAKEGYLQGQIGNPEGEDKPNKSFYDPRKWIRECESSMVKRVKDPFATSLKLQHLHPIMP
eukprot:s1229_g4.t2